MKTIVLSLGGSLIVPDKIDIDFLKNFKKIVENYIKKDYRFVVYCGGGSIARKYQEAASRAVKLNNEDLDWLGIHATRLNAHLLKTLFKNYAEEMIIKDPTKKIKFDKKILIAAGYEPGCSTDMDAVLLAGTLEAKQVVNLSNIDYAYTKDPHLHKDALPIKETSWDKFFEIAGDTWSPRMNTPFDPVASRKAKELGLEVVILNGTKLDNFKNYLYDRDFVGTRIK